MGFVVLSLLSLSLLDAGVFAGEDGALALALGHAVLGDSLEEGAAFFSGLLEALEADLDLLGAAGLDLVVDEALDGGGLEAVLSAFLGDLALDDELLDVGVAGEVPELADGGGALGAEGAGVGDVSDTFEGVVTNLGDGDVEDGDVFTEDVTTDGLTAAFTVATAEGLVADGTTLEEEGDTGGGGNTVHHGETFGILTTTELEDVAGELVAEGSTVNFSTEALADEVALADLVFRDVEGLDGTVTAVSDVELHDFGVLAFFFSKKTVRTSWCSL